MSDMAIAVSRPARATVTWQPPDIRRTLQLVLGAFWMLDAVLQFQSFMYSKSFTDMIAGTANGNPGVIAGPITWNANLVQHHLVLTNTVFAAIQLLIGIGIGIAWQPALRAALAASIAWSLGVWWFAEGLGMLFTGGASPVNGAPGAVLIYAILAVLLWPADREPGAPLVAGRVTGTTAAKALWVVVWGGMAYLALQPANTTGQGLHDMIMSMADGQPGWLASLDKHVAGLVAHNGLAASVVLAVALAVVALGVFLPPAYAKATIVLACVISAFIWVVGEALGGVLTGGGTDPNSGPLLAFLAIAYWPGLGGAAAAESRPAAVAA